MMRYAVFIGLALIVAGCGVERPLLRPIEVPQYMEEQRKKRENMIQEQQQLKMLDEQRAAERAARDAAGSVK